MRIPAADATVFRTTGSMDCAGAQDEVSAHALTSLRATSSLLLCASNSDATRLSVSRTKSSLPRQSQLRPTVATRQCDFPFDGIRHATG